MRNFLGYGDFGTIYDNIVQQLKPLPESLDTFVDSFNTQDITHRRCHPEDPHPDQRNSIHQHGLHLHQQGLNKLHASDQGGASTILSRIRFFVQRRRPEGAYGAIADQYHHSDGISPETLILLADASEIMPTPTAIKSFLQRYQCRVNESSFHVKAASMMEASPVVPHSLSELRKQAGLYATYTSNCACPNDASSTTYVKKTRRMAQDEGWGIHKDSTTRFATESIKTDLPFSFNSGSQAWREHCETIYEKMENYLVRSYHHRT